MRYSISVSIQSPTPGLLGIDRFLPKRLIPQFLFDLTLTSITFSSEKELDNNLNKLLKDHNSAKGRIHFPSQQILSMTCKTKLPSYVGKCFANINKKYPFISQVNINNKYLTHVEKNQIKKIAENAELKRQKFISTIRNHFLLSGALFALGMWALSFALPMTLGFVIATSISVGMITGLFSFDRQIYLESTLHHNNKSETLKKITPPETRKVSLLLKKNIDFKKIDSRIMPSGVLLHSFPMQTSIEIPDAHFDEIMAKLKRLPDINNEYNDLNWRTRRNRV